MGFRTIRPLLVVYGVCVGERARARELGLVWTCGGELGGSTSGLGVLPSRPLLCEVEGCNGAGAE